MPADSADAPDDLGFRFRVRKGGDVELTHRGQLAAILRGSQAAEFLAETPDVADPEAQQRMARLTGNYRRGNERLASGHPRNKR